MSNSRVSLMNVELNLAVVTLDNMAYSQMTLVMAKLKLIQQ